MQKHSGVDRSCCDEGLGRWIQWSTDGNKTTNGKGGIEAKQADRQLPQDRLADTNMFHQFIGRSPGVDPGEAGQYPQSPKAQWRHVSDDDSDGSVASDDLWGPVTPDEKQSCYLGTPLCHCREDDGHHQEHFLSETFLFFQNLLDASWTFMCFLCCPMVLKSGHFFPHFFPIFAFCPFSAFFLSGSMSSNMCKVVCPPFTNGSFRLFASLSLSGTARNKAC